MQKDWVNNSEQGQKTGILIWDLSAAFDTLDTNLLCEKLNLHGFTENTIKWFRAFLTGRQQRVNRCYIVVGWINKLLLPHNLDFGATHGPLLIVQYWHHLLRPDK